MSVEGLTIADAARIMREAIKDKTYLHSTVEDLREALEKMEVG